MSLAVRPTFDIAPPVPRPAPSWPRSLRAVVLQGLRDRGRSALTWGLLLGAYGGLMAAIYPSIHGSMDQLVKSYPSALKQAFGVEAMNTVEGYINAEMFSLIVPLAIGYFAIRAVAGPVAGAEEQGRLDTILALPLSRSALIAGTFLVAALVAGEIMAICGLITFVAGRIAGTGISLGLTAAGAMGVWPCAVFFGGVAALGSGVLHSSRSVTGLALGLLVGMYAVDLAGRLAHGLDPIRWASAFRYYGAPMRDGINPASFVGLLAVGSALVVAGALLLERRDVHN